MDTILITGGGGFIGSNLACRLAQTQRVIVCDRFGDGEKWHNLRSCPAQEILTPEQLGTWLEKAGKTIQLDAIIHMGAITSTTERDIDAILRTNFQLSQHLWHWCSMHHIPLIYASSAATYGDGSQGFDDREDLEYLLSLKPLNGYAWSKWLFDIWAVREAEAGHRPPQWAGLKFFNVYGPREAHKGDMRSVACKLYPEVMAGKPVRLFASHHPDYPDGGQRRDFVSVQDCAGVIEWLLAHADVSGLFNVGSGTARSFLDLATALHDACGKETQVEYVPMPETLRGAYQYFTEAKMSKLRGRGFTARPTSLEDGIRGYVAWLKRTGNGSDH